MNQNFKSHADSVVSVVIYFKSYENFIVSNVNIVALTNRSLAGRKFYSKINVVTTFYLLRDVSDYVYEQFFK